MSIQTYGDLLTSKKKIIKYCTNKEVVEFVNGSVEYSYRLKVYIGKLEQEIMDLKGKIKSLEEEIL